jgi:hypothetical protein
MSKKHKKNLHNKQKNYYQLLRKAIQKADADNPLIRPFSFRRWFFMHQFEISIFVFITVIIMMIMYYGKPIIDPNDIMACQLLEAEKKDSWSNQFNGGYRVVIVKQMLKDAELPMQLNDLGSVMEVEEVKMQKRPVYKVLFPPVNTIKKGIDINWNKLLIDFTEYDPITNENGMVNIVISDYFDDPNFGLRPLKLSLNRKVNHAGVVNGDYVKFYFEILADNGNSLYLLIGLIED